VVVDAQPLTERRRLWLANDTLLPLIVEVNRGDELLSREIYSYTSSRTTGTERPEDFFRVARPEQPVSDTESQETPVAPSPQQEISREEALQSAATQRAAFGLSTEAAHLAALQDDPLTEALSDLYGFPVDTSERAELDLRVAVADALPAVRVWIANNAADEFAGLYIDPLTGKIIVKFVSNGQSYLGSLLSLIPGANRLGIADADYTFSQLEAAKAQLDTEIVDGDVLGKTAHEVGIDPELNRVVLGIDEEPTDAYRAAVQQSYGSMIVIDRVAAPEQQAGTAEFQGVTPLRGGIRLFDPTDPGGIDTQGRFVCTAAMPGQVSKGNRRINVILTNAHCQSDRGAAWLTGRKSGQRLTGVGTVLRRDPGLDAEIIKLSSTVEPSRRGEVFIRLKNGKTNILTMNRVAPRPAETGDKVCISAGSTGRVICGPVRGFKRASGMTVDSIAIDAKTRAGDSGSPMWSFYRNAQGAVRRQHEAMLWGAFVDPDRDRQSAAGMPVGQLISRLPGNFVPFFSLASGDA
jgi:hypothetical protein